MCAALRVELGFRLLHVRQVGEGIDRGHPRAPSRALVDRVLAPADRPRLDAVGVRSAPPSLPRHQETDALTTLDVGTLRLEGGAGVIARAARRSLAAGKPFQSFINLPPREPCATHHDAVRMLQYRQILQRVAVDEQ